MTKRVSQGVRERPMSETAGGAETEPRRPPEVGEIRKCLVCTLDRRWGIFDTRTGATVCTRCRDARHVISVGGKRLPFTREEMLAAGDRIMSHYTGEDAPDYGDARYLFDYCLHQEALVDRAAPPAEPSPEELLVGYDASGGMEGIRKRAEAAGTMLMKAIRDAESPEHAAPFVLVAQVCTKDVPFLLEVVAKQAETIEILEGELRQMEDRA